MIQNENSFRENYINEGDNMEIDFDNFKNKKSRKDKKNKIVNILINLFSTNLFIEKNENDFEKDMNFITNKFMKSFNITITKNKKRKRYPMLGRKRRKKKQIKQFT